MIVALYRSTYSDGSTPGLGDEIEVVYPDLRPIPHRGIIYSFDAGPMGTIVHIIHSNKRGGGVQITTWQDFTLGEPAHLRRRPMSPAHALAILERAAQELHRPHSLLFANCQHFTDYCFTGLEGESSTMRGAVLLGLVGVSLLAARN